VRIFFTYFNDATHSLFMAISYDGYSFTAINDSEPIIDGAAVSEQQGIRDPHIQRGPDGMFYIVMTDLNIYAQREGLRETQWERDALGKPLLTTRDCFDSTYSWACIDPAIFVDDDDTPYILWGNRECYIARLKDNMIEIAGNSNTTHPAVVEFKGQWVFFSHNGGLSEGTSYSRSIVAEPMSYDSEGRINPIHASAEGVSILQVR